MPRPNHELVFQRAAGSGCADCAAEECPPLRLVQTIPLANVKGRIDHMAVDLKGQRLFIAALGNATVEVLDVSGGKPISTITGLKQRSECTKLRRERSTISAVSRTLDARWDLGTGRP